jgi:hypothetical protein
MLLLTINLLFTAFFIGGAVYFWRRSSTVKQEVAEHLGPSDRILVSISVPKNNDRTPQAAEQMFTALHGIFRESVSQQQHISFEVISKNKTITFFAQMPAELKEFVTSQIYAQYPNVEISVVPTDQDYAIAPEEKAVAATELVLKKPPVYPIKTFQNFEVDPLSSITGVLSSAGDHEEIWVQLIVRPIDDDWQKLGDAEIKNVKEPPAKQVGAVELVAKEMKNFTVDFIKSVATGAGSAPEEKKESKAKELSGPVQQALKGIEEKITKLGFGSTIRIVAIAPEQYAASAKLEQIVGAYKQYNTLNLNGFASKEIVTDHDVITLYRNRDIGAGDMIFNITELASLYHFPSETVATPTIAWAGSKKGEPPSNLPLIGTVPADELTVFAQTNFRNEIRKFGIKKKDRRLHAYIIGKTGTGKSTLMENMIYDDIREGRGVAVVDPHGELIDHVLDFIPEERIHDVVYFNPADHDFPIGFNILENVQPEMQNVVASGVVGIFKKIFGESWGPRLEYILRNSVLALLEYPNSTLLGVMRILTDNAYRRKVISVLKDPVIKDFFVNEYEKYEPKFRQEAIAPIQNKVGQFLSSSTIRNIVGQPRSTMDIRKIMDEGKILLADLSTGKIGEDNSALLGSMLITKIQLAAMGRTNVAEEDRRDFYLYVDEFQNFATDSFATILSEARKYRLNLVMINQYISQMPETVANAVFGNVGTMVAFRVGAADAEALKNEFQPVFDVNDLVNQPNRQIYLKMAIDGVTVPAFSAATLPPPTEKAMLKDQVVIASREAFATPKSDVEDYITDWSSPINLSEEEDKNPHSVENAKKMDRIVNLPTEKNQTEAEPVKSDIQTEEQQEIVKETEFILPKKMEILKDRFNRQWYAVSPEGDMVEKPTEAGESPVSESSSLVSPAPEAAISEQVIEELHLDTEPQSGGAGESDEELTHLITWDQADSLGLKLDSTHVDRPKINDDYEPIDEIK